jgi:hypothetical protein
LGGEDLVRVHVTLVKRQAQAADGETDDFRAVPRALPG